MRRVVLIVALVVVASGIGILVLRGRCDDGKELVEFPYVIKIAPKNILFVDGHEFHGEVLCTWEPGDSLRIEGIPVLPRRPPPIPGQPKRTEEDFRRQYGEVPVVLELVEAGATWREAAKAYSRRIEKFVDDAKRAYWKVLEATGSEELAVQAVLDSVDRTLLDPSEEPRVFPSGMGFRLQGRRGGYSVAFGEKPPWEMPTLEEIQKVTHEKASEYTRGVARHLGNTRTACLEVPAAGLTVLGRGVVKRALRQIEEAEKGNMVDGPLPERELKLILMVREGEIDETDN
jgi:hypothetical protein